VFLFTSKLPAGAFSLVLRDNVLEFDRNFFPAARFGARDLYKTKRQLLILVRRDGETLNCAHKASQQDAGRTARAIAGV
jgi:hypothetical protein